MPSMTNEKGKWHLSCWHLLIAWDHALLDPWDQLHEQSIGSKIFSNTFETQRSIVICALWPQLFSKSCFYLSYLTV